MKLPANLLKIACVIPASLIVAEASAFAHPCGSSAYNKNDVRSTSVTLNNVSLTNDILGNGFIGVAIEQLTPDRAQQLSQATANAVPAVNGVLVVRVLQDGPAFKGGLREGDVVLGVNGQMVTRVDQVQQAISSTPVGKEIPLTLRRGNRVMTVAVSVGDGTILRSRMLNP